jgi:hypothetical protein
MESGIKAGFRFNANRPRQDYVKPRPECRGSWQGFFLTYQPAKQIAIFTHFNVESTLTTKGDEYDGKKSV